MRLATPSENVSVAAKGSANTPPKDAPATRAAGVLRLLNTPLAAPAQLVGGGGDNDA